MPGAPGFVDAYCHVGRPRFGPASDALRLARQNGIAKQVLVLGPAVPDYAELFAAIRDFPDTVRGVGIPFGETPERQLEIARIQVSAGIFGMRLSGQELLAQPDVPRLLGENGRWIYAVGLIRNTKAAETLLDWLDACDACVAAPHFLSTSSEPLDGPLLDLLDHPRFYPIFSRHGGVGSTRPYPHTDLRPWVDAVIGRCGVGRILFGSEYPVIHWRDESLARCLDWLVDLVGLSPEDAAAVRGSNADRLVFGSPVPALNEVEIPDWVERTFDRNRSIPLFEKQGLSIPMAVFDRLHARYIDALQSAPQTSFSSFVAETLSSTLAGQD